MMSALAVKKVLSTPDIKTVVDLGAGTCAQSLEFVKAGLGVLAIDLVPPPKWENDYNNFQYFSAKIEDMFSMLNMKFDCVWSSHVIEHMLDPQDFLLRCIGLCKSEGYLCITFPSLKPQIVGGHVNLFNAGILLYRLILLGLDCRDVQVLRYGYNNTLFLKKVWQSESLLDGLKFDKGDIEILSRWFPEGYNFQGFNGDIGELNWR